MAADVNDPMWSTNHWKDLMPGMCGWYPENMGRIDFDNDGDAEKIFVFEVEYNLIKNDKHTQQKHRRLP